MRERERDVNTNQNMTSKTKPQQYPPLKGRHLASYLVYLET